MRYCLFSCSNSLCENSVHIESAPFAQFCSISFRDGSLASLPQLQNPVAVDQEGTERLAQNWAGVGGKAHLAVEGQRVSRVESQVVRIQSQKAAQ